MHPRQPDHPGCRAASARPPAGRPGRGQQRPRLQSSAGRCVGGLAGLAVDEVSQHRARLDRGQLVGVADQDEPAVSGAAPRPAGPSASATPSTPRRRPRRRRAAGCRGRAGSVRGRPGCQPSSRCRVVAVSVPEPVAVLGVQGPGHLGHGLAAAGRPPCRWVRRGRCARCAGAGRQDREQLGDGGGLAGARPAGQHADPAVRGDHRGEPLPVRRPGPGKSRPSRAREPVGVERPDGPGPRPGRGRRRCTAPGASSGRGRAAGRPAAAGGRRRPSSPPATSGLRGPVGHRDQRRCEPGPPARLGVRPADRDHGGVRPVDGDDLRRVVTSRQTEPCADRATASAAASSTPLVRLAGEPAEPQRDVDVGRAQHARRVELRQPPVARRTRCAS